MSQNYYVTWICFFFVLLKRIVN